MLLPEPNRGDIPSIFIEYLSGRGYYWRTGTRLEKLSKSSAARPWILAPRTGERCGLRQNLAQNAVPTALEHGYGLSLAGLSYASWPREGRNTVVYTFALLVRSLL